MEIVSKDDDLAHSMSDCFVGEEVLLVLFYGSLQPLIKNYLKIIVHNLIMKFSKNIYPISRFSKTSKTKLWLSQYFCLFVYQCFLFISLSKNYNNNNNWQHKRNKMTKTNASVYYLRSERPQVIFSKHYHRRSLIIFYKLNDPKYQIAAC